MALAQMLNPMATLTAPPASIPNLPKSPMQPTEADLKLATFERKMGQPEQAPSPCRRRWRKNPGDPAFIEQLGYALTAAGQPEAAVAVFDRLIAMQPDNAMAYNGKAVAFDHTGNHLAAQELYQQGLKLSPNSVSIQNNLAMSLILNDQYDQAIARAGTAVTTIRRHPHRAPKPRAGLYAKGRA